MSTSARAVVWDVDGVLLGTYDGTHRLYNDVVEQKLGVHTEIFHEKIWDGRYEPCLIGKANSKDMIYDALAEIGKEEHAEWYLNHWLNSKDELSEATFSLKNKVDLPHYLGTNQCKMRGTYFWENLGFKDQFMGMFASGFLGARKPEVGFFEAAHAGIVGQQGEVQPEEVIFFDDMLENIEGAKKFGWKAFHFEGVETAQSVFERLKLL